MYLYYIVSKNTKNTKKVFAETKKLHNNIIYPWTSCIYKEIIVETAILIIHTHYLFYKYHSVLEFKRL